MKRIALAIILLVSSFAGKAQMTGNPILPGNFADPFVLVDRDTAYIYATGEGMASVWSSADLVHWQLRKLNWPSSMKLPNIWAPAVAKKNGKFYLYTSTDHNIYVGVADHPAGPFKNALGGDSIFIKNRQWWEKMHSIDADCFVDDDGSAYLYWGSGFDFKDGICAVGKLNNDMKSFASQPQLVTPSGYFEGPHMMKNKGTYYLMYSDGLYYDSSYKVRYATSRSPLGPFVEGPNSPIMVADLTKGISGPGHHSTMTFKGKKYIIYHRHAQPYYGPKSSPIRQVCIDELKFDKGGNLLPVPATFTGVALPLLQNLSGPQELKPAAVTSSASMGKDYEAFKAFDNNFGSLWAAPKKDLPASITADFGKSVSIGSTEPIFDIVSGDYGYKIEYSDDNVSWKPYAEAQNGSAPVWPAKHEKAVKARYLKLTITSPAREPRRVGLWEWNIYP